MTISLLWPGGVMVGSLWLVLPSCLVSLDEGGESQVLRGRRALPLQLTVSRVPYPSPL